MDEKGLKKIIEKGETETVEFKESLSLKDEIGEEVSAFSNSKGGLILVGATDKKEIIGVQIGKKTIEDLANYIKIHTDNHVFPKVSVEEIEGKNIIAVEVSEGNEKPVFFKGRAYGRVGNSTHKLSAPEIRKLAKESGKKVYWDSKICENASLEDIDEEKVRRFLRKAKNERNFDIEPETPVLEALQRLELLRDEKLTNAAVLLFGKNPQKFFLQAETRCGRFKGTEPVKPFIDMKVFGGDIMGQVDKSMNFALEHIPMKVYLAGRPEREEKYEYPPDAIREAIINAICHRDYEEASNVQIRIFDDRTEVWGCGRLLEPLTPEDLKKKHRSILRNPLIAKCFFLIKFVEQWGTGTNDIITMCLDWGLPEPLFEEIAGSFVVTFRKYQVTGKVLEGLTERQRKIMEHLLKNKRLTVTVSSELLSVSEDTALRELSALINMNLINKVGKGKSTYYALK